LTFGTFDSPQDVGHLRVLEQGQSQIPTLSRGGEVGVYIDSCITATLVGTGVEIYFLVTFATTCDFFDEPYLHNLSISIEIDNIGDPVIGDYLCGQSLPVLQILQNKIK
jgi:hypothetical protein